MNAKPIRSRIAIVVGLALPVTATIPACNKAASEPALISNTGGPAGFTWNKSSIPNVGSFDLPSGGKWQQEGLGASNAELDMTISVQVQGGVEPSDRTAFIKGLIDVNKRDAPKYEVVAKEEGQVNQIAAGKVDGKFDNGTAYATRDYVLMRNHLALAMMVRGPIAKQADVQAVADHVAASLK